MSVLPNDRESDATDSRVQGPILFHYTSYESLLKIIGSGTIWASNILYLNDGSEFAYAHELLLDVLTYVAAERPAIAEIVEAIQREIARDRSANVFVASFSTQGDLLSQWRAYCPTARGVTIGIANSRLANAAGAQGFRLSPCIYDRLPQEQIVKDLVVEFLSEMHPAADTTALDEWARRFTARFRKRAPYIKHPAFAEEREWRLVSAELAINDERVQFRQGSSFIVPYCEFSLPRIEGDLALDEIVVGPTPHPELAYDALLSFLAKSRSNWIYLKHSSVPYRPW